MRNINREAIAYLFFGALTTLVNIVVYYASLNELMIANVPSVIIAWTIAVIFAFITNKLWVFNSKKLDVQTLSHELKTFFACRIATGLLDVAIMYLAVDVMSWNAFIWKWFSNVLVIVSNYLASKLIIFAKA